VVVLVLREHKVIRDKVVQVVELVHRVLKVLLVQEVELVLKEHKVIKDNLEPMQVKVHRVLLVLKVLREIQDLLDRQVFHQVLF
jgi:5-bromo-4-chloroindolyl phosphate hydrolysis protein